jgi:GT2 family glycosyltransferase
MPPRKIALCTTCRNRTQHLKQTLPRNLADAADDDNVVFVVVNYNSQDDLMEWLRADHSHDIASGKLVVYTYADANVFHMAHAKNVSHRCGILEGAQILVNVDADNFIGAGFTHHVRELIGNDDNIFLWSRMIPHVLARGISGRIAVSARAFVNVGGYDECFATWSCDDKDFNQRLRRMGYEAREIDVRFLDAIRHNDKMRFREYPHAAKANYEDGTEIRYDGKTIANFGNFGCGIVCRNSF